MSALWEEESILDGWKQAIRVEGGKWLHQTKSQFQEIGVFESASLGRVLVIDKRFQLTSADYHAYHEMFTHVPLLLHGSVSRVLVIGGGDGGTVAELCRHGSVKRIVQVDIDEEVIRVSREYLPTVHRDCWSDERVELVIGDGAKYVKECKETFDLVIVDSTDDENGGPSSVLYKAPFYSDCAAILAERGIVVTQNGHPQFEDYPRVALAELASVFTHSTVYQFSVPTYLGGVQTFGWGCKVDLLTACTRQELEERWKSLAVKDELEFFTPAFALASFTLPRWLERQVEEARAKAAEK